jgi:hypothetical protein
MPNYDYTCCSKPQDDKTFKKYLQQMRKERVRCIPTRKIAYRNKLIQIWNACWDKPLMHFHRSCMVQDMYKTKAKIDEQLKIKFLGNWIYNVTTFEEEIFLNFNLFKN